MLSQIIKIYSDFSTCSEVGFIPLTHISCLNWGEAHIRNHNPIASGRSIPDKHCFSARGLSLECSLIGIVLHTSHPNTRSLATSKSTFSRVLMGASYLSATRLAVQL